MKRILVGVDGSGESQAAARYAASIAVATGSTLELAHALPDLSYVSPELSYLTDDAQGQRREHAQLMLHDLADAMSHQIAQVDTSLLDGRAAHMLAEQARRPDVWLVVVGHRGRGAVERTLLGSVADRLVEVCPKPVLVVR